MPGDWQMGLTGILRDASHLGWKGSGWKSSGHDVDTPRFLISRTGRRVAYGKNKFLLRYFGPGPLPGTFSFLFVCICTRNSNWHNPHTLSSNRNNRCSNRCSNPYVLCSNRSNRWKEVSD